MAGAFNFGGMMTPGLPAGPGNISSTQQAANDERGSVTEDLAWTLAGFREKRIQVGGKSFVVLVRSVSDGDPAEFQIDTVSADTFRVWGGTVYGLGLTAEVPEGLEFNTWTEVVFNGGTDIYLSLTLEPQTEQREFYISGEETVVRYAIDDGGTITAISFQTGTLPDSSPPEVDPDTGDVSAPGVYHIRLGSVVAGGYITQSITGPIVLGFCAPNSLWFAPTPLYGEASGVGNMSSATYDPNGDGSVVQSDYSLTAPWTGISGKPAFGTAALLDSGTSVGNVVTVEAGGLLPALDGSQLTNLPGGSGTGNIDGGSALTTYLPSQVINGGSSAAF